MRTMSYKKTEKLLLLEANQMREGEMFLGNATVKDLPKTLNKLKPLKTLRIGQQAYDITALPLNRAKHRPLFLHGSEMPTYDKIMTSR